MEASPATSTCPLASLATEVISLILGYLSPYDLIRLATTCRILHAHATSERLWQRRVQANVPAVSVTKPFPCESFRALYGAHHRRWFLSKYKIWMADLCEHHGSIMLARYDPRHGSIEGHHLVAGKWPAQPLTDRRVTVKPHLDKPVLKLNADMPNSLPWNGNLDLEGLQRPRYFTRPTTSMGVHDGTHNNSQNEGPFHNLLFARVFSTVGASARVVDLSDSDSDAPNFSDVPVWPPPNIPAQHRVARHLDGWPIEDKDQTTLLSAANVQACTDETSHRIFRIHSMYKMRQNGTYTTYSGPTITYATLEPTLYTPTPRKPWRGIWVGDYRQLGCEFVLIHQPDDNMDANSGSECLAQREHEPEEEFAQRQSDALILRGRFEGIKLTGDCHVPRGEITFEADLGVHGDVEALGGTPEPGSHYIKTEVQVAAPGYLNHSFVEAVMQLFPCHNRIALHLPMQQGILVFRRLAVDDIDKLLRSDVGEIQLE